MTQRAPTYRISSTVVMNTKRRPRTSNGKSESEPSRPSAISDENLSGVQEIESGEQEVLLAGPENEALEGWSPVAADEGDVPIEALLLGEDEAEETLDDEEILLDGDFDEDSGDLNVEDVFEEDDEAEDDEAEGIDEDDDEESLEEDDELAAQASSGDFDEDEIPIPGVQKRRVRSSSRSGTVTLDDIDEDDNIDSSEDVLDPLADGFEPVFEVGDSGRDEPSASLTTVKDEQRTEEFDEESAEDIRNAANILSKSGILGIGLGEAETDDISQSQANSVALSDNDSTTVNAELSGDDLDFEKLLSFEDKPETEEKEEVVDKEPDEVEDIDADYDDEYTLTTESSVGRVWELNEDTYVTITEPGEAYPYELDEEDEEDQEMSTVRRGKQGGWSGGLASYPASSDLPVGSKEWIARRSYELIAESSAVDMFRWTKRHLTAPPLIDGLYPDERPEPVPLGKQILKLSTPETSASVTGTGLFQENLSATEEEGTMAPMRGEAQDDEGLEDYVAEILVEPGNGSGPEDEKKRRGVEDAFEKDRSAMDRSMTFPYVYKFKIEGSGEGFPECVQDIVKNTLGRDIEDLPLAVERSGRYDRVEFNLTLENSKEITDLFDALRTDARIKRSYG
ncbi:hypothetical protein BWQ96_08901 [Gracilariopsis chorda]|uniref:Uncharacterized protein n=1 Tax=Gracilariopsis chorda TaxID=448386 RepID=A0A2V3IHA7_9FLOR|nr:hypothetical protein BWQ96_08901 [Gracilariopsis chorda]|eukprot:PXF41403.1 hypothetical protein BWQ96_08901 [Gracilariopsis chorda]